MIFNLHFILDIHTYQQSKENHLKNQPLDQDTVSLDNIKSIDSTAGKKQDGDRPRFSFRIKHSEYELFIPDTVDGEFIF